MDEHKAVDILACGHIIVVMGHQERMRYFPGTMCAFCTNGPGASRSSQIKIEWRGMADG